MVPYQVLQELDNIKDCSKKNETIKSLAMGSIKYLEKYLQGSDEYVQGKLAYAMRHSTTCSNQHSDFSSKCAGQSTEYH